MQQRVVLTEYLRLPVIPSVDSVTHPNTSVLLFLELTVTGTPDLPWCFSSRLGQFPAEPSCVPHLQCKTHHVSCY